ncbi:MAG: DUF423 domain-containing protein [Rhodospirillales bacterium]|nr:DUF423 domain-containing protein [Rhodospirillales bacterium]
MNTANRWILIAAISGALGVLAGSYGWHGLAAGSMERDVFNTGVQYQMWHTLALLGVAWLTDARQGTSAATWANRAGWLFVVGMVLFSGSTYFYGLFSDIPFQGSAPAGGIALIAGWLLLAVAATRPVK